MPVHRLQDPITTALVAARRARDAELRHTLLKPEQAGAFARLLDHPYLLPLAELVENQCTTLTGARILLENLLATYEEITLSEPLFYGACVETLVATEISRSELRASLHELCSAELAANFIAAVRQYRCIDDGFGIVPQQTLFEEELQRKNGRFLQRVVRISDGQPPLNMGALKTLCAPDANMSIGPDEKRIIDLTTV